MRTLERARRRARRDRRRRLHRPGDGRSAHHPRPRGHTARTAARGAADRRPRARRARPRRARAPRRRRVSCSTRVDAITTAPDDSPAPARSARHRPRWPAAAATRRRRARRRRRATRHRARRGGRRRSSASRARSTSIARCAQPARRVRRRRLRRDPPPAARVKLPAARHHRAQAGPDRGRERPRRERASSPAASAPRSSRSSTSSPPAPACATTKPTAPDCDPLTVASHADDHKAYYPGSHPIAMRYTGDRATVGSSASSSSAAWAPRSPNASTSPPPRSSTA